jgi:NodT family efflux transporter outer membrane factor (OMF) lipoprotein
MRHVSIVLVLAACNVGPNYVRPVVQLPPGWSENDPRLATNVALNMAWWSAFNDEDLNRLVEIAYQENLPLQIAGLRILEARAQVAVATGQQYPQVQLASAHVAAVGLSEHAPNYGSAAIDRNFGDYQIGFDVLWEADIWRKYANGVQAEEGEYLARVADYDGALVSLTAEVARTYTMVRTFDTLLEQARKNVEVQEEGLRLAQARFRAGASAQLDVTQATTILESTRATIPGLAGSAKQTRNALCTLVGRTTDCAAQLVAGVKVIPMPPAEVAIGVPAELLRRRPDIRGAEVRAMAQCSRVGVAKADLYPRFSLSGSVGLETSTGGGPASHNSTFGDIFSVGAIFYNLAAHLFYPILNYGRIENQVRVQDARLQQLLVDYRSTVIKAAQEAEDGMIGLLRAQEAVVFAQNAANAAEQSVQLAFVQYREGTVDFQRVLEAQRELLAQQNNLAQARSTAAVNFIALYKALGGGWELRRGRPVISDPNRIEMQRRTNWGDFFDQPPSQTPTVPQTQPSR